MHKRTIIITQNMNMYYILFHIMVVIIFWVNILQYCKKKTFHNADELNWRNLLALLNISLENKK